MRVLFDHQVFSYQQTGGVSRYFAELFRLLPTFGCQVKTGFSRTVNRYLLERGTQRTFLGANMFKGKTHLLAAVNKIESIRDLKAGAFDLFHPTYYDPYFLQYLKGKPFVLTIHDMIHELYPDSVSDAAIVQKRKYMLAQKASLVIAVSENTRQDAIKMLGLSPAKVLTIHHGNALTPEYITPAILTLPSRFILYVGGRSTYKNVVIVWQAFAQLLSHFPDLEFIHAGGGSFTTDEQEHLKSLGITSKVHNMSVTDSGLATLYREAECLVYPSKYEGFGLPLIEALAWNCPVLAARASCLPEVGDNAVRYADPENTDEWVMRLEDIISIKSRTNPVEMALRIERARTFTWETSVKATIAAYQTAVQDSL